VTAAVAQAVDEEYSQVKSGPDYGFSAQPWRGTAVDPVVAEKADDVITRSGCWIHKPRPCFVRGEGYVCVAHGEFTVRNFTYVAFTYHTKKGAAAKKYYWPKVDIEFADEVVEDKMYRTRSQR